MTTTKEAVKDLLDERAKLWNEEGKKLADIANLRDFAGDEADVWERVSADISKYDRRIEVLKRDLAQEEEIRQFRQALDDEPAVRAALEGELRAILVERTKSETTIAFTGKDMHRVLAAGTAAAGGNTVPVTFLTELVSALRDFSSVLGAGARILTTASGEDIEFPTLATPGSAVANIPENTGIGGTDPTFGKARLSAREHGQLIVVPRRLIADSAIDIESLVVQLIAENIAVSLGAKLAIGTGTNETAGIAVAATAGVTGAAGVGGSATFDNLIDLIYSIKAPYRARGAFLIADAAFAALRKQKGTDGQYVWSPSVQVGQPDLILGKPVYADAYLEYGVAKPSIVFGDISRYWVRLVNSIEIARSDHANFSTNQVAFRGLLRADGLLTDAAAVKKFIGGAA